MTCLAWHCDGKWIVSGSEDGSIRIWDTRAATVQRNFDSKSPVNDVVIHPNQGELVSCDQAGSIKVWDLTANTCTHELLPEEDTPMRSVSVAQDGSCLVGGNNAGRVYIWSIRNGDDFTDLQPKTKFDAHDKYLIRCMLSPDGKCVRLSVDRTDRQDAGDVLGRHDDQDVGVGRQHVPTRQDLDRTSALGLGHGLLGRFSLPRLRCVGGRIAR